MACAKCGSKPRKRVVTEIKEYSVTFIPTVIEPETFGAKETFEYSINGQRDKIAAGDIKSLPAAAVAALQMAGAPIWIF